MGRKKGKMTMKKTKIQWTTYTWNPWHGCKKVSEGCKNCYMYRDKERYGADPTLVLRSKTTFNNPLHQKEPSMIFTCSWSDWFIDAADEWRDEAWAIIKQTPQHTYQILTKRPERITEHLPADWGEGYPNVWLGVSCENQKWFDIRVPILLSVPAKVRFVSAEPLLSEINMGELVKQLDWVIVGGESGNTVGLYRFRVCKLIWIENIVKQCLNVGTSVFVKQLGNYLANELNGRKKNAGDNYDTFPESIRVRLYPKQKTIT